MLLNWQAVRKTETLFSDDKTPSKAREGCTHVFEASWTGGEHGGKLRVEARVWHYIWRRRSSPASIPHCLVFQIDGYHQELTAGLIELVLPHCGRANPAKERTAMARP